jgi:hypothetical protein
MNLCHYFTVKAELYFVVEEINKLTHHMYMAYSKEGMGDVQQGAINCQQHQMCVVNFILWLLITTKKILHAADIRQLPELNWTS